MSTFVEQRFYLLCNRVRTSVGFPVNVKFFLADTTRRALPRKSLVVAEFLTGFMSVLQSVGRYVSAYTCKNSHLLQGLKTLDHWKTPPHAPVTATAMDVAVPA